MTHPRGTGQPFIHQAFGLLWSSDVALHDFEAVPPDPAPRTPDITVTETRSLPATRAGLVPVNRGAVCADGVRFKWGNEVSFDTHGAEQVLWQAGSGWTGRMPQPFFSTLTAILLGWRGMLPVHGSAVEIGGRGYLICGPSGAGKSTLAAGLVALGARLISDDLTVVVGSRDGEALHMVRGRTGIRLVPAIADYFSQSVARMPPPERRDHKLLVRAAMVPADRHVPLAGLVMGASEGGSGCAADPVTLVQDQVFRRKWMSALPRRPLRETLVRQIAATVPIIPADTGMLGDRQAFLDRADKLMARLV